MLFVVPVRIGDHAREYPDEEPGKLLFVIFYQLYASASGDMSSIHDRSVAYTKRM